MECEANFSAVCCCVPCRDRWWEVGGWPPPWSTPSRPSSSSPTLASASSPRTSSHPCIPLWNIAMETVGDRPYFAGQHRFSDLSYILPNVIPACIVLVTFIAIPPILLLDYPMRWIESAIFKSPALTRWYPKVGIGIVLDAFQGCFHDDKL